MASCITSHWDEGGHSPQVKLVVTESQSNSKSVTLSWKLYYIAEYPASAISPRTYTVVVGGAKTTGEFTMDGKTGTILITTGTKSITKKHSDQSISFSVSFPFDLKWSGTYGGTKTARGSISVDAKPSYTITYNANGGSGAPNSDTKWYEEDLILDSTEPTRTGYSFSKWNTASDGSGKNYSSGGTYTANSKATLYAQWTANTYTVSYNANKGSGAPADQTKTYGVALTLSTTKPTRTGYTFQGWATSSTSNTISYKPGASYTSNKAITLYAVWKRKTYTIKYNANGGSGAPSNGTKTHGVDYTISSTAPTRTNYRFLGWGTSPTSTKKAYDPGSKYTTDESITLYAVWELNYSKPTVSSLKAERCSYNTETSSYDIDDYGTYAKISFKWSCDQNAGVNNVFSVLITFESTTRSIAVSGTSGTVTEYFGSSDYPLDIENTHTFTIEVTDSKNGTTTKLVTLPGAAFPIDVLAGGKGVSIGAPATEEKFDVYMPSRFNDIAYFYYGTVFNNLTKESDAALGLWSLASALFFNDTVFDNNVRIHGTKKDTFSCIEAFNPINEHGNTIVGYGHYEAKEGDTNIYGHDVNIGVSNVTKPDKYRPYYRKGDSIDITIRTSGYTTANSADVCFVVPLSKPIIGSPTISVSTINGFKLRQNNKYTHGSKDQYAVPTSYTASISPQGVQIKASFTTVTNAINNSPIGIHWDGRITLS